MLRLFVLVYRKLFITSSLIDSITSNEMLAINDVS